MTSALGLRFIGLCCQHMRSSCKLSKWNQRQRLTRMLPACNTWHTCSRSESNDARYIQLDKESDFAVLHMANHPANTFSTPFLREVTEAIVDIENDKRMKGLIITSACPNIYSSGLELTEVHQATNETLGNIWRATQDFWITLYDSRLATVAAVNGHAIAGGCSIPLMCDYRIMADGPYTIGYNAVRLGIVLPTWVKDIVVSTVGHRRTEMSLELGMMYKPEDALRVGMVDEIVPEDQILDRAKDQIEKWIKIPETARVASKRMMREGSIRYVRENSEEDVRTFIEVMSSGDLQIMLGKHLQKLKQKDK